MELRVVTLLLLFWPLLDAQATPVKKPNIIVIMADDMGYECLGCNGSTSYATPHLDAMAARGVRFTNAFANPICTPTRCKIMTGLSNIRNYVQFRVLERSQKTFAHYLKDVGYRTCVAGKWQLGTEKDSAQHFGFEQSLLWQHTRGAHREGSKIDSRHVNPRLERNGEPVNFDKGEFSSDLCVDFIDTFMTKHKDEPFLVYYPMILPHCPFIPTPGTPDFNPKSLGSPTYKGDAKYFKAMVGHIDKMVKRIEDRTEELGIADNTLIVFTADNGTDKPVKTKWQDKIIPAGKGTMRDAGVRVPLIVKFPERMKTGLVSDAMVDLSDVLPTLCEAAAIKGPEQTDGASILPLLKGEPRDKDYAYIFYNRDSGALSSATVMARTRTHQILRVGQHGKLQFSRCVAPYQLEKITAKKRTPADQQAFQKLSAIIAAKDKLHGSALPKADPK